MDRATSGSSTRIGLTYYFFPTASCTASTCQLDFGYISSGSALFTAPVTAR